MHLVCVLDPPADADPVVAMATALDIEPYDARQRLVMLPSVATLAADLGRAEESSIRLQRAGFRTAVLNPQGSPFVQLQLPVREFHFDADSVTASSRHGAESQVPWDAVRLILRGTAVQTETRERTERGKKFSVGMAVATGGMVVRRRTKTTIRTREEKSSGFVHVYATKGRPLTFSETSVDFKGLGSAMEHTRTLNMKSLLEQIRTRAPGARFDDRLMRRSVQAQMLGPGLDPDIHLPIASALLAVHAWGH